MKILIVVTKCELGGAQVFVRDLAAELKERGEDVAVAGGMGKWLPDQLAALSVPFHALKELKRSYDPRQLWRFPRELADLVRSGSFDVVHLNSSNALAAVWKLRGMKPRPKLVFTVHGLSFLDPKHRISYPLRYSLKLFFQLAWKQLDHLVFVSRLNSVCAQAAGLAKGGELIPNGVSFAPGYFLGKEEAVKELSDKAGTDLSGKYIYGSVGRLAYPKNYEFLINAHIEMRQRRPEARLVIIGDGPERAKYQAMILSYRLEKEVFLIGEMEQAGRYIKAFDLFVLPSKYEGLSLSLLEAAAAGITAIASRTGGNEEIIGQENCFRVDDITDFMEHAANARPSGLKPEFRREEMINHYLEIYRK